MKKQTALELFRQRLIQRGIGYNIKDFEEAKEMEKKQIIDSYYQGDAESDNHNLDAEQYYNETFK